MFFFDPSVFQILDTENVLITKRAVVGANVQVTTIYQGAADLQEGRGSTDWNPSGAVPMADAQLTITTTAANLLPSVAVGQLVENTDTGKKYTVVSVAAFGFAVPHLEIGLKIGPAGGYGPSR